MPLMSPPPPPAVPRGGRARRRSRIRRRRSRRNWAALPLDALLHVFHKLDDVNLMLGGVSRTCRSWRSAAREPELWRRIDLRGHSYLFRVTISLDRMARLAIWFSAGQCVAFMADRDYVDGDLLLFLAERAPLLKSLRLTEFHDYSRAFMQAIKKFPLLEELELYPRKDRNLTWIIEIFAIASPQLKHFKYVDGGGYVVNNSEALAIARMHGLRSLQLFNGILDNEGVEGLTTILDNCPHLEFLELRNCCNVVIDSNLREKCARIKTTKLYPYVYNDFTKYFEPTHRSSFRMHHNYNEEHHFEFLYAEDHDSDDYDHSCYFSGADEADLKEHERIFDKGTRMGRRID